MHTQMNPNARLAANPSQAASFSKNIKNQND